MGTAHMAKRLSQTEKLTSAKPGTRWAKEGVAIEHRTPMAGYKPGTLLYES